MAVRVGGASDAILFLCLGISVKVARVALAPDLGDVRSPDLPSKQSVKVDSLKPAMVFDIIRAIFEVTVTLGEIRRQQALQQIPRMRIKILRPSNAALENLFIQLQMIVVIERRVPSQHFKDQNAQAPPVRCFTIALGLNDFGCCTGDTM